MEKLISREQIIVVTLKCIAVTVEMNDDVKEAVIWCWDCTWSISSGVCSDAAKQSDEAHY